MEWSCERDRELDKLSATVSRGPRVRAHLFVSVYHKSRLMSASHKRISDMFTLTPSKISQYAMKFFVISRKNFLFFDIIASSFFKWRKTPKSYLLLFPNHFCQYYSTWGVLPVYRYPLLYVHLFH